MKVLLDTNILLSAAFFPSGVAARAFDKAVLPPYRAIICDYSLTELRRVFQRKFPTKEKEILQFESRITGSVEIVATPTTAPDYSDGIDIRDTNDYPILWAALHEGVDAIITGDKDFLESGLKSPMPLSASEFLRH